MSNKTFDNCVECGKSTAPGSGLWANRLPGLILDAGTNEYHEVYWCVECVGDEDEWSD